MNITEANQLRFDWCKANHVEPWRQTGRTTAMVKEVVRHVGDGQKVLILVHDAMGAAYMRARLTEDLDGAELNRVSVVSVTTRRFAQLGKRYDKMFIDHAAWELNPFATARTVTELEACIRTVPSPVRMAHSR